MHRAFTAMTLLSACATQPTAKSRGELVVTVEATSFIGHIDFTTEDGSDVAQLTAVEPGTTEHTLRVGPGNWCLREVGIGAGAVGVTLVPPQRQCVAVGSGGSTNWGTIAVDGQNIQLTGSAPPPRSW